MSYADLVPGTGCKEPASVLAKLGHGSPAGMQRLFSPGGTTMPTEVDYSHQGLVKLMLKMPALRGRLQILSRRNPDVLDLCAAFGEASVTLERLLRENSPSEREKIEEYRSICDEIESDIISLCATE
ncbi:MAG: hypothetical protein WBA42_14995 [Mesorhizobium sp.]